ncbi:NAD(P)-binding protein [Acephala macrosclerotiorum]|nr:NAD(P)-binding protein [Acephala macrosclerotiorum]
MTKSTPFSTSGIPDFEGRVVLITGGHSGLGLATTTALAAINAKVYIASRSNPNAQIEVIEMDLGDLKSVKSGAEDFLRREEKLHILINNAGVHNVHPLLPHPPKPRNPTCNKLPLTLSPYLPLTPTMLETAKTSSPGSVRVVNVSSDGHNKLAPKQGVMFENMNLESKSTWTRYGHSKLCNVLHSKSLAAKYGKEGLIAVSLHPGTVKTNLSAGPRGSTPWYGVIQPLVEWGAPGPDEGCGNIVWCAAGEKLDELVRGGEGVDGGGAGKDDEMAERLWGWSEGVLKRDGFLE